MDSVQRIIAESATFKHAASFLPKHKIDAVAQFADSNNIYAMHYGPITDEWAFSCGETYSTIAILAAASIKAVNHRFGPLPGLL